jgi:hypothetical protein
MALPAGKISIYKKDGESNELVGEDNISHTPKNEEIELTLGSAFDIVVDAEMTGREKLSKRSEERTYLIKVKNHKDSDVSVLVRHWIGGDWELRKSGKKPVYRKGNKLEFLIDVKSGAKVEFTYSVLTKW